MRDENSPGVEALPAPRGSTPGSEFLTIEEVAALYRVPKSWLYERTRTNAIPHYKLGKYVRFRREELDAWMAQQRCGPKVRAGR